MKRKQVMALMLAAALTAGSVATGSLISAEAYDKSMSGKDKSLTTGSGDYILSDIQASVNVGYASTAESGAALALQAIKSLEKAGLKANVSTLKATSGGDLGIRFSADGKSATVITGSTIKTSPVAVESQGSFSWEFIYDDNNKWSGVNVTSASALNGVPLSTSALKNAYNTASQLKNGFTFKLKGTYVKPAGVDTFDGNANVILTVTVAGESKSNGGSSGNNATAGTGAASNGGGTSTNNNGTTDTTPDNRETKTNADGSTTVTTTREDGTVIAVTTSADGNLVTTVTTNPDGSKKERTVATNGNVRTVVTVSTKADGTQKVTATVKDSEEGTKLVFSNSKNDGTLKLASADTGDATSITVPSSVKVGNTVYTVTRLASNAFTSNPTIETVKIGKSIKVIGGDAFASCENLTKVVINGPVLINKEAFLYCDQLKTITFKGNVGRVSKNAFKGINKNATFNVTGDANASKARYQKIVKRVKAGNAPKTAKFKRS